MKKVLCKNCQSSNTSPKITKNGFHYFQCNNCQIIFLAHSHVYERFVKNFYTKGYFTGGERFSGYNNYEKNKKIILGNFRPIIQEIKKYLSPYGKHLDIGSAFGYLLELTQNEGFDPYGIEPSRFAAKIAQKKFGNRIVNSTFEKAQFPKNSFSLITMFDVVEHLNSPAKAFKKVASLLAPGGLLVIWTCDQGSFFARLCGSFWHFYTAPQHLFVFNKHVLASFLKKAGLTTIRTVKKGKWVSLAYFLHLARTIQKSKTANILFHLIQDSTIGNIPIYLRFNDSIIVFAKK